MSLSNLNFDIDNLQEYDHNNGGFLDSGIMTGGGGGRYGDQNTMDHNINETPMFELDRVQYNPNGVISMQVCSSRIIIATKYSKIIRIDLNNTNEIEEIDFIQRPDEKIYRIFLDPSGMNLLISMENEAVYYLPQSSKKPRKLNWKGVTLIESVAWGEVEKSVQQNVNYMTMSVLIGTNKGKILETTITSQEKGMFDFGGKEPLMRLLYATDDDSPITGMRLERSNNKFFAIITTPTRFYQLVGGPNLENLFAADNIRFDEIPSMMRRSDLCFFSKSAISLPQSFAWMIGQGVYNGDLIFGSQNAGDRFTTSIAIADYTRRDHRSQPIPPIAMALTEFHFLFLYSDCLQAVNKLSGGVVFESEFDVNAKLRGISVDSQSGTTWVYGESSVYELIIREEDRHAWKLYLEKGQFETALNYAKEPYAMEKRDQIWGTQADHYFKENKFELAATFYGKTKRIFEEITLKFIGAHQREALKTYLLQKLAQLAPNNTTQKTIICTWLTEIFVSRLNSFRVVGSSSQMDRVSYEKVQSEFTQFLNNYKDNLDEATTFHIISSHGAIDELLYYAKLIEDYERVISYYIQHQQYEVALNMLTQLKASHQNLYYKFCPILFHFIPYQTVNVWMQASFLNPRKLIPSLMRYDHSKVPKGETQNQAIRYLLFCVKNRNTDKAVHNYLLSLYVKQEDDRPLLSFLQSPEVYFDLKYALRLCMKERKLKACVLIYSALGLYEEAVDLSLEVDIGLAKENAEKVKTDDEALCKKLWLRIARHVVEKDNNIKEAMEFLQHCTLLKIEDILPFFPDFTVIDDFKEEICKSLEDYNQYIDQLKNEMDDATNSADLIRKDIHDLRNKYGLIRGDQKCDICNYPVLTKRFYLFSCQHVFHSDCLITEMMKYLDDRTKQRVRELQMSVGTQVLKPSQPIMGNTLTITEDGGQEDSIKNELDRIVSKECIYCGDLMIKSIEKPFIGDDEQDLVSSWEI